VRLWRTLPLDKRAADDEPGGALWFPRSRQGRGRHDNPDLYGCLYLAEEPVSAVAELLAPFRGTGKLLPSMLVRYGTPVTLVGIDLPDRATVVDLDDPATLLASGLSPSRVATRNRTPTQEQASALHEGHPAAAALRWWSTLEASWINWTLFERAAPLLEIGELQRLSVRVPVVREAARLLGLALR
jgi:RES domain